MTQVTPAANHPLRIKSEVLKSDNKSDSSQSRLDKQMKIEADIRFYFEAGGCVDVLTGFPEVIKSRAAHSWMAGF